MISITASAQSSAFTYQGRLTDNAMAANGSYDIRFALYPALTGGTAAGTQTANPIVVTNGLFSSSLDFGAAALPGADRWLEIAVRPSGSAAAYTVLSPRQKLASAPYAFRAASAATSAALTGNITASQISGGTLAVSLIADGSLPAAKMAGTVGLLNKSGNDLNYTAGNVGIGTASPQHRLDVDGNLAVRGTLMVDSTNLNDGTDIPGIIFGDYNSYEVISSQRGVNGPNRYGIDLYTANARRLSVANNGNVGIGTPTPQGKLDVVTGGGIVTIAGNGNVGIGTATPQGKLEVVTGVGSVTIRNDANLVPAINVSGTGGLAGIMRFRHSLEVWPNDAGTAGGRIDIRNKVGGATIALDGESGDATVKTLTITGGSDLAEPFDLADAALEAGTVVVIDDSAPGRLEESSRAYDKCVAGVVSGAGGINPGISLQQEGINSGGRKVALTGRVYVRAEADSGPIEPGDLLTTSAVKGHAMSARDSHRCQGAVLGKAMSRLEKGRGLVLILVTLQ